MAKVKMKVQVNCPNDSRLSGYADKIKFYMQEATKEHSERQVLSFLLHNLNNDGQQIYDGKMLVFCYNRKAVEVNKFLKPFMFVTVNGELRATKQYGWTMIAEYVDESHPVYGEYTFDVDDQEAKL